MKSHMTECCQEMTTQNTAQRSLLQDTAFYNDNGHQTIKKARESRAYTHFIVG